MESNFRTLYYYIVTAEELNFTRAAQKLYITQQSLSAHIKKLEAQYEVVLFERRPALRLTLAGERLLKYAKQVIEDENNLFNDFKNENAIGRIRLNIGIPPQRILPYLPDIYQAYHRKQPHVIPSCVSYSYIDADLALRAGNIQLYFSILSQPVKFGTQQFLGDDTLYFVISAELLRNTCPETWRDFLSRYVKGISITDTIDFPVILPPLISSQRLMMNLLYDKLGYSPNVQMETADNAVALELCVRGCCGAFLPKSYLANA